MSEQLPSDQRLRRGIELALRECAEWSRHQPYIWKQKTMEKLEKLGYVEKQQVMYAGRVCYQATDKGREYLAKFNV